MGRRAFFQFKDDGPEKITFPFRCNEPIKAIFKIAPPTVNYELLINKPKINHVELIGDKSLEELGITAEIIELIAQHNTSEEAHEFIRNLIAQEIIDREAADALLDEKILQEILDRTQADTELGNRISDEAQARISADEALQDNINAEAGARTSADQVLQNNINGERIAREAADAVLDGKIIVESSTREQADTALGNRITTEIQAEAQARTNADTAINTRIDGIGRLIPSEASPSNKLADKEFVVDNIKTYAASYRGSWATWAAVPTNAEDYPADADGNKTPDANDYMIVTEDETQDGGTWRYIYTGTWAIEGKSGWKAEYKMQNSPFSPEQQAAIDSGITSALVTQIGVNESDISGINTTLSGFGNIVTHSVAEFATAVQGALADTAVQPEDLGDGTITFIQGDEEKGSITVNQKGDTTIYLDKGGDDLFNIDGGKSNSVYIPTVQVIDGGKAEG